MKQFLMMMISMSLVFNLPFAAFSENTGLTGNNGLYIYPGDKLAEFFQEIHYPHFWQPGNMFISRNSDGTALRFLQQEKKLALVLTCDGDLKEIPLPGYPVWFTDLDHMIAWHNEKLVNYENGKSEEIWKAFSPYEGADPSGAYFVKSPRTYQACPTTIYASEHPYQPLWDIPLCGPRKIFFHETTIYLFGIAEEDAKNHNMNITTLHTFKVSDDGRIIPKDTIKIQKPEPFTTLFSVADMNPWKEEILFLDNYDLPSRSRWYTFNLESGEMTEVGKVPTSGGIAFFLQCDILDVTKKKWLDTHKK